MHLPNGSTKAARGWESSVQLSSMNSTLAVHNTDNYISFGIGEWAASGYLAPANLRKHALQASTYNRAQMSSAARQGEGL